MQCIDLIELKTACLISSVAATINYSQSLSTRLWFHACAHSASVHVPCHAVVLLHGAYCACCRFPIGKTDQIKEWSRETLYQFWKKWYFPANATLYVVGDLDRKPEQVVDMIKATFGQVPAGRLTDDDVIDTTATSVDGNGVSNGYAHHSNGNGATTIAALSSATPATIVDAPLKQRHDVRPPVEHKFGYGPLAPGEQSAPVSVFRHPLLQHFQLSIFCKLPVRPMVSMSDLRRMFITRILVSVFQFRINVRYVDANPSFVGIELDISDSGREGCAVSTLTITSEPKDWQGAVSVAVEEVRRLQRFGITAGELERYRMAMLRDSAQVSLLLLL